MIVPARPANHLLLLQWAERVPVPVQGTDRKGPGGHAVRRSLGAGRPREPRLRQPQPFGSSGAACWTRRNACCWPVKTALPQPAVAELWDDFDSLLSTLKAGASSSTVIRKLIAAAHTTTLQARWQCVLRYRVVGGIGYLRQQDAASCTVTLRASRGGQKVKWVVKKW